MLDQDSEVKRLFRVGVIAAFATLAFVGTLFIRIPLPASGGYFNLGDTFVMAAGLLYGPMVGALVGLIGPACADWYGYPPFILATAVVKLLEGGMVGLVGYRRKRKGGRPVLGLIIGIAILVSGYFIFEAYIYPALAKSIPFFGVTDYKAAVAELLPNLLQGTISAVVAFGIWRVFGKKSASL